MIYAKYPIKQYHDKTIWAELFKKYNTESTRRYAGRRMFRLINKSRIRAIMHLAKYPDNFNRFKPITNERN